MFKRIAFPIQITAQQFQEIAVALPGPDMLHKAGCHVLRQSHKHLKNLRFGSGL